ncbi:hypothetical protein RJ640_016981 [Escallonia rubra]|uniref:Aldose 1-epimerase n=1 Tax=Escallonia rubra TaxID=112253 RepID=A0AA88QG89_9ASTE|nr:hypothetical protein RJ640_016981 [Escallonia rubra]
MSKISTLFRFILVASVVIVSGCLVCGEEVGVYELKKGDFSIRLTNWGASIISVVLPDKNGKLTDIALGYDSIETYKHDSSYLGSIVGRVANLIAGAQFTLDGIKYKLNANAKNATLHGGRGGLSEVAWKVTEQRDDDTATFITFTYHSPDGEEGFPGELLVSVTYTVTGLGPYQLSVSMRAEALTKATPVSLAQHTYWNLGGHNSGNILSHEVQIFSSCITPKGENNIPIGRIETVVGTPYDFLQPHIVGSQMSMLNNSGYDINYVLEGNRAAVVYNGNTGIMMELLTDAPGMQFYTANFGRPVKGGKGGITYQAHAGLCLESQGFPDSVNHPYFPSQIIPSGDTYRHDMLFTFSIKSV